MADGLWLWQWLLQPKAEISASRWKRSQSVVRVKQTNGQWLMTMTMTASTQGWNFSTPVKTVIVIVTGHSKKQQILFRIITSIINLKSNQNEESFTIIGSCVFNACHELQGSSYRRPQPEGDVRFRRSSGIPSWCRRLADRKSVV